MRDGVCGLLVYGLTVRARCDNLGMALGMALGMPASVGRGKVCAGYPVTNLT